MQKNYIVGQKRAPKFLEHLLLRVKDYKIYFLLRNWIRSIIALLAFKALLQRQPPRRVL